MFEKFLISVQMAKQMLKKGLIVDEEYLKLVEKFSEKYPSDLSSLYLQNELTLHPFRANM